MTTYEHLTHNHMDNYYADVVREMTKDSYKPDVIFAPMRGGADFGIKLSNYYDIPFVPLMWQTRDGSVKELSTLAGLLKQYSGKEILIVDDICDTGETFKGIEAVTEYDRTNVRFAAAIENIESSFACDYAAREISRSSDTQWFVFPWENWWKRTEQ